MLGSLHGGEPLLVFVGECMECGLGISLLQAFEARELEQRDIAVRSIRLVRQQLEDQRGLQRVHVQQQHPQRGDLVQRAKEHDADAVDALGGIVADGIGL
jgi:hypothetical protein